MEASHIFFLCLTAWASIHWLKEHIKTQELKEELSAIQQDENGKNTRKNAKLKADDMLQKAKETLDKAYSDAEKITNNAEKKAQKIAGDAYRAIKEKDFLEDTIKAIKNTIDGYGEEYLAPSPSALDELADEFTHTEAGTRLASARIFSASMVKQNQAADCSYSDETRRQYAIEFVLDAFNGKVDSIISRIKSTNIGILRQEIKDAYQLVNYHGAAFRDAHIKESYLNARLDELNWGTIVLALKEEEREEQRAIKEKIREEERVKRELEKALKDAAKEEELINKSLEKARKELEQAGEEKRAEYEIKLAELQEKLKTAEEKNQRALSMAQQTKAGHVYIISNIGSFGDHVYKIGMTRRLEPQDRIKELGDASVPFEFDVHAMIYSNDAPGLEKELHRTFNEDRINKVNYRKEFFKVNLTDLKSKIESMGIKAKFTLLSQAAEYRETLTINQLPEQDRKSKLDTLMAKEEHDADAPPEDKPYKSSEQ